MCTDRQTDEKRREISYQVYFHCFSAENPVELYDLDWRPLWWPLAWPCCLVLTWSAPIGSGWVIWVRSASISQLDCCWEKVGIKLNPIKGTWHTFALHLYGKHTFLDFYANDHNDWLLVACVFFQLRLQTRRPAPGSCPLAIWRPAPAGWVCCYEVGFNILFYFILFYFFFVGYEQTYILASLLSSRSTSTKNWLSCSLSAEPGLLRE